VKPDTFLFDLAGVLLEWNPLPLYLELYDHDRDKVDYFFDTILTDDVQCRISKGQPLESAIDALCADFPEHTPEIKVWKKRWHEMILGESEEAVRILRKLQNKDGKTYLLGNWSREEYGLAEERFDFLRIFDGTLVSGDVGIMKPDAAIFEIAVEKFQLQPEKTLFIDDKAENVNAALALGFQAVVFEDAAQLETTLINLGVNLS
jgi:2-haloacid dehalogenase